MSLKRKLASVLGAMIWDGFLDKNGDIKPKSKTEKTKADNNEILEVQDRCIAQTKKFASLLDPLVKEYMIVILNDDPTFGNLSYFQLYLIKFYAIKQGYLSKEQRKLIKAFFMTNKYSLSYEKYYNSLLTNSSIVGFDDLFSLQESNDPLFWKGLFNLFKKTENPQLYLEKLMNIIETFLIEFNNLDNNSAIDLNECINDFKNKLYDKVEQNSSVFKLGKIDFYADWTVYQHIDKALSIYNKFLVDSQIALNMLDDHQEVYFNNMLLYSSYSVAKRCNNNSPIDMYKYMMENYLKEYLVSHLNNIGLKDSNYYETIDRNEGTLEKLFFYDTENYNKLGNYWYCLSAIALEKQDVDSLLCITYEVYNAIFLMETRYIKENNLIDDHDLISLRELRILQKNLTNEMNNIINNLSE